MACFRPVILNLTVNKEIEGPGRKSRATFLVDLLP